MFLSKTWGCCHIKHPGVVMQNMGMLCNKTWGCYQAKHPDVVYLRLNKKQ